MNSDTRLADEFLVARPAEAARCLERHAAADVAAVLAEIAPEPAAQALAHLQSMHAASVLVAAPPAAAGAWLSVMPHAAAARTLRRLDDAVRAPLLARARPGVAAVLRRALAYPPDTAAGLMDARGLALPGDLTVAEALARFRRSEPAAGSYLYVVGAGETLEGVLGLRELLAAARQSRLRDIMARDVARIPARADRDGILDHPGWRRHHELPVVEERDQLLGIIRHATARRLERDGAAARPASGTLAPWLHIGELYWVGMAKVVGSLLSALGSNSKEPR